MDITLPAVTGLSLDLSTKVNGVGDESFGSSGGNSCPAFPGSGEDEGSNLVEASPSLMVLEPTPAQRIAQGERFQYARSQNQSTSSSPEHLETMFERPTPSLYNIHNIYHWDRNTTHITLPPSYLNGRCCPGNTYSDRRAHLEED
ncbi:hypothetical protein J4Q44_G00295990 [Coregonus suidteri]|uniref:Uncharacterized protein n=1 Tax=Coregonus suidteri TaxID=861788 RepID=A0AAN8L6F9_9TELE